ncbi:hypothetical protein OBBRIDRAFT_884468 [Obba rivulosa]|uniref:KN homeodomain domain-containing protein n=1 Tax=Obba rivulosa TaxID=1052685 RepID=A0A8E2J4W3_9APHY|nr:hypothetical protein OBBRIDRAFT_884468 [Obba rivulosa]
MRTIRERLLNISEDFLIAIVAGTTQIERFNDIWSELHKDFDSAMAAGQLDDDTISLAHSTTSRVAIYASAFHDLYVDYQQLTADMMSELEMNFARMTLSDTLLPMTESADVLKERAPSASVKVCSWPKLLDSVIGVAPFEHAAYSWLITHLHDPYPSKAVREAIARSSQVDTDVVSRWFKAIRAQIGWNASRTHRFQGSRNKIVRAAHQAFANSGGSCDLADEDLEAFMAMKAKVLSLMESFQHASHTNPPALDFEPPIFNDDSLQGGYLSPIDESDGLRSASHGPSRTPSLTFSSSDESEKVHTSSERQASRKRRRDESEMRQLTDRAVKQLWWAIASSLRTLLTLHYSHRSPLSSVDASSSTIIPAQDLGQCLSDVTVLGGSSLSFLDRDLEACRPASYLKRYLEESEEARITKRARIDDEGLDAVADWLDLLKSPLNMSSQASFDTSVPLDIQLFSDWTSLSVTGQAESVFPSPFVAQQLDVTALDVLPQYPDVISMNVPNDDVSDRLLVSSTADDLATEILGEAALASFDFSSGSTGAELLAPTVTTPSFPSSSSWEEIPYEPISTLFPNICAEPSAFVPIGAHPTVLPQDSLFTPDSPPPSFFQSTGDMSAFDWDNSASVFTHPYDIDASPPPYEATSDVNGSLCDVLLGKIGDVDPPEFDGAFSLDASDLDYLLALEKLDQFPEMTNDFQLWTELSQTVV